MIPSGLTFGSNPRRNYRLSHYRYFQPTISSYSLHWHLPRREQHPRACSVPDQASRQTGRYLLSSTVAGRLLAWAQTRLVIEARQLPSQHPLGALASCCVFAAFEKRTNGLPRPYLMYLRLVMYHHGRSFCWCYPHSYSEVPRFSTSSGTYGGKSEQVFHRRNYRRMSRRSRRDS